MNAQDFVSKKGLLDLRNYYFPSESFLGIEGEWKFFHQSLNPENQKDKEEYITLPYLWSYSEFHKEPQNKGFSSYQITILFPPSLIQKKESISLYLKRASTAYQIKVFDEKNNLLSESAMSGILSDSKEQSASFQRPILVSFIPKEKIIVQLQVSNFLHYFAGPGSRIYIGKTEGVWRENILQAIRVGFIQGFLWIIAIYHLCLYAIRRKDITSFWFGYFCVVSATWSFLDENYLQLALVRTPMFYPYQYLFEFCFFSMPFPFLLYLTSLLELKSFRISKYILISFSILLLLINLCIPLDNQAHLVIRNIYLGSIVVNILWVSYIVYYTIRYEKNSLSKLLFSGILIFFLCVIYDIFWDIHLPRSLETPLTPYGIAFFLFFQAIVIAVKNQRAYAISEKLSFELEDKVETRTSELNSVINLMKKDLNFAQKIQISLLPIHIKEINNLIIRSEYKSIEEVGGDIFDISDLGNGITRIFLADATGHGVRAALITMLIKSEYDSLKKVSENTKTLIMQLNNLFYENYYKLYYLFSCIVVDIDNKKNEIRYTSAGHPKQYLIQEDKIIGLERTGVIPGLKANAGYEEIIYSFRKNDKVLLFTDGFFEEFNAKYIEYGEVNLFKIIEKNRNKGIQTIIDKCFQDIEKFLKGKSFSDDVTVIGIENKGWE